MVFCNHQFREIPYPFDAIKQEVLHVSYRTDIQRQYEYNQETEIPSQ